MALAAGLGDRRRMRLGIVPLSRGNRGLHRLDFLSGVLRPQRRLGLLRFPERLCVGEPFLKNRGVLGCDVGVGRLDRRTKCGSGGVSQLTIQPTSGFKIN